MSTLLLLKAAHLVLAIVWLAGVLLQSVALAAARRDGSALPHALLAGVARWDRRVTVPAMVALYVVALLLAQRGGWLQAGWLHAKLAAVVALSALHGVQAGRLRRLAARGGVPSAAFARIGAGWIAAVAAIVALAVLKPF